MSVISMTDGVPRRRRRGAGATAATLGTVMPHGSPDAEARATLEELLTAVGRGDRTAFATLYDAVSSRVLGLVIRLLRDRSQSEEVTQEVLLEIWQNAGRFEAERGSAMSWIFTIAHRRAVDRIRSAQKSHERDLKIGIREMGREFDSVTESVEIRIENERVKRAMGRLTPLQREAVVLAYYGGYTHSEMSQMLRIPIGTVKTRLRDGMIRLRDELGVTE